MLGNGHKPGMGRFLGAVQLSEFDKAIWEKRVGLVETVIRKSSNGIPSIEQISQETYLSQAEIEIALQQVRKRAGIKQMPNGIGLGTRN